MRTKVLRRLSATAVVVLGMLAFASPAWAETFTVENPNTSGTGSLRAALEAAAADQASADVVVFRDGFTRGPIRLFEPLPPLGNVEIVGPGADAVTVRRAGDPGEGASDFGIFTVLAGRTAKISGLTISDGRSIRGGGIYQGENSALTLEDSVVFNNWAQTAGGGVFGARNSVTHIVGSTFNRNSTDNEGGGMHSGLQAGVSVTNSTFSNNTANAGGSIWAAADAGLPITITNVTVSGNSARGRGGGIFTFGAGTIIRNTIIAGNSAPEGADLLGGLANGSGFNRIGGTASAAGLETEASGNPVLKDNGGPTPTVALLDGGGSAVDRGDSFGTTTDQRGEQRPKDDPAVPNAQGGDGSDIGAFEGVIPAVSISDVTVTEGNSGTTDAVFTVRLPEPAAGTVSVDYATANGTATAPDDYAETTGTLTFSPGETTKTFAVPVGSDAFDEPDETFYVNLSNLQGTGLPLVRSATGTILNDDDPKASNDSYTIKKDTRLVVGAPGVLGNDTLPAGVSPSATKLSNPSNGILAFNADGSFSYAPNPAFVGTDSFTYRASVGTSESNVATVRITVTQPPPPPDRIRPTVLKVSPTGKKVSPGANVTASFSEAMNRSTLNRATVKLIKKGTRASVAASVKVSANGRSVVLNPKRALSKGATYTATITTGARDLAGNPLLRSKVWSFKVRR